MGRLFSLSCHIKRPAQAAPWLGAALIYAFKRYIAMVFRFGLGSNIDIVHHKKHMTKQCW